MVEPQRKSVQDSSMPDSRRFGVIFAAIFIVVGTYLMFTGSSTWGWSFVTLAMLFCTLALAKPALLQPLNRLWFAFGNILGRLISPLVLSIMFFLIFTPIGLFQRLSGRDILQLRSPRQSSYWRVPDMRERPYRGFRDQF